MGFRFRRSVKILPGIRLNFGKRGISTSIGVRGAHVTYGPTGTRTTIGLPGSGLSYTHLQKSRRHAAATTSVATASPAVAQLSPGAPPVPVLRGEASHGQAWIVVIVIVVTIAIGRWTDSSTPAPNPSALPHTPLRAAAESSDDKTAEIDTAARGAAQIRRTIANARTLKFASVTLLPNGDVCYRLALKNTRGVPYVRTAVMEGAVMRVSGSADRGALWERRCDHHAGRDITADISGPRSVSTTR